MGNGHDNGGRDRLLRGRGQDHRGVGVTHRHYCEGGAVSVVRLGGRLEGKADGKRRSRGAQRARQPACRYG